MPKHFLSFECAFCFLALVLTFPVKSSAQTTIHSKLGPGDFSEGSGGRVVAGSDLYRVSGPFIPAMPFVTSENADRSEILIALTDSMGPNAVTVTLDSDESGIPGTVIEVWDLRGLPTFRTTSIGVRTLTSSSDLLSRGMTYWLFASPATSNTEVIWNLNSTGASGVHADFGYGGWYVYWGTMAAFAIEETSSMTVPEPSSLLLLGSGFVGLLLFLRFAPQRV